MASIKPTVVVTGFGPYGGLPSNASWEAVKVMNKDEIESKLNIDLVRLEVPVEHEFIDEKVPQLWKVLKPKLVIHVGLSGDDKNLILETVAHRTGYDMPDNVEKCVPNHLCPAQGPAEICTKLDVQLICKQFNKDSVDVSAVTSTDAGRYVSEYLYYTSLSVDRARTLFVHVPDDTTYSLEQTATALERILELCLQQVNVDSTEETAL